MRINGSSEKGALCKLPCTAPLRLIVVFMRFVIAVLFLVLSDTAAGEPPLLQPLQKSRSAGSLNRSAAASRRPPYHRARHCRQSGPLAKTAARICPEIKRSLDRFKREGEAIGRKAADLVQRLSRRRTAKWAGKSFADSPAQDKLDAGQGVLPRAQSWKEFTGDSLTSLNPITFGGCLRPLLVVDDPRYQAMCSANCPARVTPGPGCPPGPVPNPSQVLSYWFPVYQITSGLKAGSPMFDVEMFTPADNAPELLRDPTAERSETAGKSAALALLQLLGIDTGKLLWPDWHNPGSEAFLQQRSESFDLTQEGQSFQLGSWTNVHMQATRSRPRTAERWKGYAAEPRCIFGAFDDPAKKAVTNATYAGKGLYWLIANVPELTALAWPEMYAATSELSYRSFGAGLPTSLPQLVSSFRVRRWPDYFTELEQLGISSGDHSLWRDRAIFRGGELAPFNVTRFNTFTDPLRAEIFRSASAALMFGSNKPALRALNPPRSRHLQFTYLKREAPRIGAILGATGRAGGRKIFIDKLQVVFPPWKLMPGSLGLEGAAIGQLPNVASMTLASVPQLDNLAAAAIPGLPELPLASIPGFLDLTLSGLPGISGLPFDAVPGLSQLEIGAIPDIGAVTPDSIPGLTSVSLASIPGIGGWPLSSVPALSQITLGSIDGIESVALGSVPGLNAAELGSIPGLGDTPLSAFPELGGASLAGLPHFLELPLGSIPASGSVPIGAVPGVGNVSLNELSSAHATQAGGPELTIGRVPGLKQLLVGRIPGLAEQLLAGAIEGVRPPAARIDELRSMQLGAVPGLLSVPLRGVPQLGALQLQEIPGLKQHPIAALPGLWDVRLRDIPRLPEIPLAEIRASLPGLNHLPIGAGAPADISLSDIPALQGLSLGGLISAVPGLGGRPLASLPGLEGISLSSLMGSVPVLGSLNLSDLPGFADQPLGQLFPKIPGLADLPLGQIAGTEALSAVDLLAALPGLESLPIGGLPGVLDSVLGDFPSLLELPIAELPGLSAIPLSAIPDLLDLPSSLFPGFGGSLLPGLPNLRLPNMRLGSQCFRPEQVHNGEDPVQSRLNQLLYVPKDLRKRMLSEHQLPMASSTRVVVWTKRVVCTCAVCGRAQGCLTLNDGDSLSDTIEGAPLTELPPAFARALPWLYRAAGREKPAPPTEGGALSGPALGLEIPQSTIPDATDLFSLPGGFSEGLSGTLPSILPGGA